MGNFLAATVYFLGGVDVSLVELALEVVDDMRILRIFNRRLAAKQMEGDEDFPWVVGEIYDVGAILASKSAVETRKCLHGVYA